MIILSDEITVNLSTGSSNCVSPTSATSTITVTQVRQADAGYFNEPETNICQGDSAIFNVSKSIGDYHKWYSSIDGGKTLTPFTSGVFNNTIIRKPTPINKAIDEITYYHETGNACDTASTEITFSLDQKAVAGTLTSTDKVVCEGASANLKLTNSTADYYQWQYLNGSVWSVNQSLTSPNVNIIITDTITYRALCLP